jgi:sugar lactone lactonase YvrE
VAVDAVGDIFISDTDNQRIREVDHATGIITTIAGNGTAGFSGDNGPAINAALNFPRGLTLDASGHVFIADTANNRVREVTIGGSIVTVAGDGVAGFSGDGGPATAAHLNRPWGLAFDASGNLYVTDSLNNRVRKVVVGGNITTFAGDGTAGPLNTPFGLAFDSRGNLYIADTGNERVRLVDTRGLISTVVAVCGAVAAFSGDGGMASLAHVNGPFGLAVDGSGDLFIADVDNNRVRATTSTLVGVRGASCQGSASTSASRTVNQSPSGTPGPRLDQAGASRGSPFGFKVSAAQPAVSPQMSTGPTEHKNASAPSTTATVQRPISPTAQPATARPVDRPGVRMGARAGPAAAVDPSPVLAVVALTALIATPLSVAGVLLGRLAIRRRRLRSRSEA